MQVGVTSVWYLPVDDEFVIFPQISSPCLQQSKQNLYRKICSIKKRKEKNQFGKKHPFLAGALVLCQTRMNMNSWIGLRLQNKPFTRCSIININQMPRIRPPCKFSRISQRSLVVSRIAEQKHVLFVLFLWEEITISIILD